MAQRRNFFPFRTNCMVHVCMGLYEVSQYRVSVTFGGAGKSFGSWQIICLRRINIVSDFLRTSREGKNKMKSEIDKSW